MKMTTHSSRTGHAFIFLLLTSLLLLAGCKTDTARPPSTDTAGSSAGRSSQSESQFVVIDTSEPAFTVFTGIPKALDEQKLAEIKRAVSGKATATMLSWQDFVARVDEYAHAVMLRDDYPGINSVDGIVCLVGSRQGTGAPWGLVWNGGIALTFNDYQHARRSYQTYKTNPATYEPIADPRRDPIHPNGHLPFAGCN